MKDTGPMISVCIPTYNYGHFLPETIQSVLSQTYKNFELIIVDNCSMDDTSDIVARFQKEDPRIMYRRNGTNLGMAENWNRCLEYATGEYIKILCADDLLEPTCLEACLNALECHPEVALVAGMRILTDAYLRETGTLSYSNVLRQVTGEGINRMCFFEGNVIGEPTAVIFRKRDAGRGFKAEYKQLVDMEMWMHILEKGDFLFLPIPVCRFRQHAEQGTKNSIRSFAVVDDLLRLYRDYIHKEYLGDTFINRERWRYRLARDIWEHRHYGLDVRVVIRKMKTYYPFALFLILHSFRYTVRLFRRGFRRIVL